VHGELKEAKVGTETSPGRCANPVSIVSPYCGMEMVLGEYLSDDAASM